MTTPNVNESTQCATALAQAAAAQPSTTNPSRRSKSALVIDLLQREEGATLAELVDATGWLQHSARAALTRLKKKGHVVDRAKRAEVTCYRILEA